MLDFIISCLLETKARDVVHIEVDSPLYQSMVIVTATSTRHAKALARNLQIELKKKGIKVNGVEGENEASWILIDVGEIIVHVFLKESREYYKLEEMQLLD